MSRYREWDLACKVYVGNLGSSASKHEIESAFGKYGPLRNVWVARNPPGFAFVEFEDPRDAEDAVRGLDGTRMCGTRVRVEMSTGRSRRGGGGGGGGRRVIWSSSDVLLLLYYYYFHQNHHHQNYHHHHHLHNHHKSFRNCRSSATCFHSGSAARASSSPLPLGAPESTCASTTVANIASPAGLRSPPSALPQPTLHTASCLRYQGLRRSTGWG
ncbi:hypothetical protein J437_LFUL007370 [Ladona fulva]|uniref:RRM domain-containing protein n=1 Tax=Ladona fulva TaxID=123851 RepID=A0A8K0NYT3_LADFU|nr:hypothetical protein J437_LFUL007370 [Ladona fulva]